MPNPFVDPGVGDMEVEEQIARNRASREAVQGMSNFATGS